MMRLGYLLVEPGADPGFEKGGGQVARRRVFRHI